MTTTQVYDTADGLQRRVLVDMQRHLVARLAVLTAIVAYLVYAWIAFDVTGLMANARPERAAILATDAIAHKVHVTKSLRTGEVVTAVEGERTATYSEPPQWIAIDGELVRVDLGNGHIVEIAGESVRFTIPEYGTILSQLTSSGIRTVLPDGPKPEWVRATKAKFDARPDLGRRVQLSRSKIEIHRYFLGWENFFFPFRSELSTYTFGDIASLAISSERLNPDLPNWRYIFSTFWNNPDWQHGNVFVALLETVLMAVLGTLTAAIVALPLAFLAAGNFTPARILQFLVRRLFDLLRGIDMLVWSLIFIRAFGLGPLTGALAIAFTDTGTLGKLFSEALENIDEKQVEGVKSTGAGRIQSHRFGVMPQILPVFVSQGLYYLESNMRSATVIGALGAGGIGLMLVETMRTSRDWENTAYIIILTIMLVIAMDKLSGWLRQRLIHGKRRPHQRPV